MITCGFAANGSGIAGGRSAPGTNPGTAYTSSDWVSMTSQAACKAGTGETSEMNRTFSCRRTSSFRFSSTSAASRAEVPVLSSESCDFMRTFTCSTAKHHYQL